MDSLLDFSTSDPLGATLTIIAVIAANVFLLTNIVRKGIFSIEFLGLHSKRLLEFGAAIVTALAAIITIVLSTFSG